MNQKTTVLVVSAMCLSFCLVLGLVGFLMSSTGSQRKRVRTWAPPPIEEILPQRRTTAAASTQPAPIRKPISAEMADFSPDAGRPGIASLPADSVVAAAASLASRHITRLRRDLGQQVAMLKKSRDSMLDELALQLSKMSPEKAAAELGELDDESAGLVLSRLSKAQRKAILRSVEPRRSQVLDRKARTWAAK